MNTVQEQIDVKIHNFLVYDVATDIMEILDDAYEIAPENILLQKYYQIDENETDFYNVRKVIETVLSKTYLFSIDTGIRMLKSEIEIINNNQDDPELIPGILTQNRDSELFSFRTKLLSLKGQEWVAEIIGKKHPLYQDLKKISTKISGYFLYKGQDTNDVFLEYITTGERFNITKKSFENYKELTTKDTIVYIGIINWKQEWWFSGIYAKMDYNPKIIEEEKRNYAVLPQFNELEHYKEEVQKVLEKQYQMFLEFNNGSQITFLPSDEIEHFTGSFIKYYNENLNLSKKERDKIIKKYKPDNRTGFDDYYENVNSGLVFFNPKSGIEIFTGFNSAFPLPNNKFFKPEESEDTFNDLLYDEYTSPELVGFCINNCHKKLPFLKETEYKIILNDLDFLLRFWKKENYFPKPQVSVININK